MKRLRQFVFGWFCRARGFHSSGKREPKVCAAVNTATGEIRSGAWLRFLCVCGAETMRNADVDRGGRVVIPVTWPLERLN